MCNIARACGGVCLRLTPHYEAVGVWIGVADMVHWRLSCLVCWAGFFSGGGYGKISAHALSQRKQKWIRGVLVIPGKTGRRCYSFFSSPSMFFLPLSVLLFVVGFGCWTDARQ